MNNYTTFDTSSSYGYNSYSNGDNRNKNYNSGYCSFDYYYDAYNYFYDNSKNDLRSKKEKEFDDAFNKKAKKLSKEYLVNMKKVEYIPLKISTTKKTLDDVIVSDKANKARKIVDDNSSMVSKASITTASSTKAEKDVDLKKFFNNEIKVKTVLTTLTNPKELAGRV